MVMTPTVMGSAYKPCCATVQAEPSAKLRTELLQQASMEYQASGDLGTLQPDTPTHSVRSLLNTLMLKQIPSQVYCCDCGDVGPVNIQHLRCTSCPCC